MNMVSYGDKTHRDAIFRAYPELVWNDITHKANQASKKQGNFNTFFGFPCYFPCYPAKTR